MNATVVPQILSNRAGIGDETLIADVVDALYDRMLDDYRVNRFFSGRPVAEQTEPLKVYLKTVLGSDYHNDSELLDDYFMAAFARTNAKRSLVNGNDFAFLLDIVGGREIRTITLLCDAHSHLMKLNPDDFHYDVVMEHLADSLNQLQIADEVLEQVLAIAESARDGVLGRGCSIQQAA